MTQLLNQGNGGGYAILGAAMNAGVDLDARLLMQYSMPFAMYGPALDEILGKVSTPEMLQAHIKAHGGQSTQINRTEVHVHGDQAKVETDGQPKASARQSVERGGPHGYTLMPNGVALVGLRGGITKYGSSFSQMAHGTLGVRQAIREATHDPEVKAIMMVVDSPGGSVAGTDDLALDFQRAGLVKPTGSYNEDLCASAGYYVGSQATVNYANANAMVGSIGVYTVLDDWSGFFAEARIKRHVIASGKHKGKTVPGQEITGETLQDSQRTVDAFHDLFVKRVAEGRGMDPEAVEAIADGRIHIGHEALSMGLVDHVCTLDEAIDDLLGQVNSKASRSLQAQSKASARVDADQKTPSAKQSDVLPAAAEQETNMAQPTIKEIKAACPKADSSLLVTLASMAEDGKEMAEIKDHYTDHLSAQLEAREKQLEQANQQLELSQADATGVEPVGSSSSSGGSHETAGGSARDQWNQLINEKQAGGMTKQQAAKAVATEHPDIRQAMVEEHNETHQGAMEQIRNIGR